MLLIYIFFLHVSELDNTKLIFYNILKINLL